MTTSSDLGWAGGFFDGEGCVHVRSNHHGSISIQVAQRVSEPLERFQRIVGVGRIYPIRPSNGRKGGFTYAVGSVEDVIHLCNTLIPFTTVKRNELIMARRVAAFGKYSRDPKRRKAATALKEYQILIRR